VLQILSAVEDSNEGWVGGEAIGSPPCRKTGSEATGQKPRVSGERVKTSDVRLLPCAQMKFEAPLVGAAIRLLIGD